MLERSVSRKRRGRPWWPLSDSRGAWSQTSDYRPQTALQTGSVVLQKKFSQGLDMNFFSGGFHERKSRPRRWVTVFRVRVRRGTFRSLFTRARLPSGCCELVEILVLGRELSLSAWISHDPSLKLLITVEQPAGARGLARRRQVSLDRAVPQYAVRPEITFLTDGVLGKVPPKQRESL